jgi:ankyrin repeat protein
MQKLMPKNNYGWNGLMVTIKKGHKEIIKLLKEADD